jgi:hypothetical protein
MRKRLGSSEKAPITQMEQSLTSNSFSLVACVMALIMSYFGVRFMVDFLNFLEKNMDGNNFIGYDDQIVMISQGVVGLISVAFIMGRK